MLTPATVLVLAADVRYRTVGEEMVLLSQAKGEVMVVNAVAARVVAELDGTTSLATIASRLADRYEVSGAEALADVLEFADRLAELGFASVCSVPR